MPAGLEPVLATMMGFGVCVEEVRLDAYWDIAKVRTASLIDWSTGLKKVRPSVNYCFISNRWSVLNIN